MCKVIVFAERMLPSTQTFIPIQVNALRRYKPQYVGLIPAERNLELPGKPVLLTPDRSLFSRVRRELYRWSGVAPSFHGRVKACGAQLLHAHFAEGGPPALFLSKVLGIPFLLHLRGGAELFPDAELSKQLFQLPYLTHRQEIWKRASLFLCVSEYIRQKAILAGFPEEKVRVHYTGMSFETFNSSLSVEGKDSNLVLYVGRLVPYKGCDYLIRAMKLVREQKPNAHLVVIGGGEMRASFERLAAELQVPCQFLGEQKQDIVRHWYQKARVFCGPSLTLNDGMSEAFGNVFSEAQAMGVPVVSFRHGGIPETMLEGVTGLLAPERDVEMLAAHLFRFLDDEGFWMNARKTGMTWVREKFDVRSQTAKLEELYDQVIGEASPAT